MDQTHQQLCLSLVFGAASRYQKVCTKKSKLVAMHSYPSSKLRKRITATLRALSKMRCGNISGLIIPSGKLCHIARPCTLITSEHITFTSSNEYVIFVSSGPVNYFGGWNCGIQEWFDRCGGTKFLR
eukprot:976657_1